jgi:chemotaxis receptor (MCP) glutamine deamidase CheD
MLNVSATQELARRLERLEAREARLASLEKAAERVTELESELSALKALVVRLAAQDTGGQAARTVAATSSDRPATREAGLLTP